MTTSVHKSKFMRLLHDEPEPNAEQLRAMQRMHQAQLNKWSYKLWPVALVLVALVVWALQ